MDDDALIAQMTEHAERLQAKLEQLAAEHPDLPFLTVMVMANDAMGAENAEQELRAGKVTYDEALLYCGSYSRLDAALRWQLEGFATRDELLDRLPRMWPSCDPDDTDPRFLALWREARARAGDVVTDGARLPEGDPLTLYRGQRPADRVGFAWSLDEATARKFAGGASFRAPVDGEVLKAEVPRSAVLAYLTGRGESEVIVDPDLSGKGVGERR